MANSTAFLTMDCHAKTRYRSFLLAMTDYLRLLHTRNDKFIFTPKFNKNLWYNFHYEKKGLK